MDQEDGKALAYLAEQMGNFVQAMGKRETQVAEQIKEIRADIALIKAALRWTDTPTDRTQ